MVRCYNFHTLGYKDSKRKDNDSKSYSIWGATSTLQLTGSNLLKQEFIN